MSFFHYSAIKLQPGSVIEPGNYGRMLRLYPQDPGPQGAGNGWKLAVELVFEQVRRDIDPALPGRLDSCFMFEKLADAQAGLQLLGFNFNLLYEVQLVDASAPVHRADIGLINAAYRFDQPLRAFWPKVHDLARSYWGGAIATTPELLTASPLRIVAKVP
jgi:hypothetical protein